MNLITTLMRYYSIGQIINVKDVSGGYVGNNKLIETATSKYFLKQYKDVDENRIREIHLAYRFFDEHEIPVISPLNTKNNSDYFIIDNEFYALFPFINERSIKRDELTFENLFSVGELLGRMHKVSLENKPNFSYYVKDRTFNIDTFISKVGVIIDTIEGLDVKTELDIKNLEELKQRISYINSNRDYILTTAVPADIILTHRDFHERNLFFDDSGKVSHIYDFDNVGGDSAGIELSRALLLVCFPGRFNEDNFARAKSFLYGYSSLKILNKNNFKVALKFYIYDYMFSKWLVEQYYLRGNKRTQDFMEERINTISYMVHNKDLFIERIFSFL